MVTKEKLDWIKANRMYGDQKAISDATGVNFNTVVAILRGAMYGTDGDLVIDTAFKLINDRQKKLERERKAFAKATHK